MADAIPINARGESSVIIDGERRVIKFTLGTQARIVEALELGEIAEIPQLLRCMDAKIVATLIHCSLVGESMSVEDLLECVVPLRPATVGIIEAINLANWGTVDGPPEEAEKAETGTEAPT